MNLQEQHFLRELGLRLRQRREELGLTQAELGRRCGLHRTFIGSVERGERNLSILNLRLLAQVLRLPLSEVVGTGRPPADRSSRT
jgi:transcriptional regulator with XRE-family HTH domain